MSDLNKIIILLIILITFIMAALLINTPVKHTAENTSAYEELKREESVIMEGIDYREIKGSQILFRISAEKGNFSFSRGEGDVQNINGEIYLPEERNLIIKSKSGRVAENGNLVILKDNVSITMADGTEFTSESMSYNVHENIILTEYPVSLRNKTGTIKASSMKINLNDDIIQFSGNVDAVIKKFLSR